jgi:predicted nuclease with TOPRIM domain
MNSLKDLFTESYIDVPESKVDLVDELAAENEELEEKLNAQTGKSIAMQEELEVLKRDKIVREASRDLADTQVEKLKDLVEDIDFEDEETFAKKVDTVKESYFSKKVSESADIEEEDEGDAPVVSSDTMAQYLSAIQKTNKK